MNSLRKCVPSHKLHGCSKGMLVSEGHPSVSISGARNILNTSSGTYGNIALARPAGVILHDRHMTDKLTYHFLGQPLEIFYYI